MSRNVILTIFGSVVPCPARFRSIEPPGAKGDPVCRVVGDTQVHKNKPNKGLLKRIRITKSGRIKFSRAFGRHLRSHKSGSTLRGYRKPAYAKSCDVKRLERLLWTALRSSKVKKTAPVREVEAA